MRAVATLGAALVFVSACQKPVKLGRNPDMKMPSVSLVHSKTPEAFQAACRKNIENAKTLLVAITQAKGPRTVDDTLVTYNDLSVYLSNALMGANLFTSVHPDEAMRTAAETCEREASAFATDLGLNRDLYDAIRGVDVSQADEETKRLVERTLRDFRRSGVDKDEATRMRVKELSDRMVAVGQTFDKNIREDVRSVKLDPAQLDGLPEDYKRAHPVGEDGKVTLTTDTPDLLPYRTYAKDGAARRALYKAFLSRAFPANDVVLKELLALRKEYAELLGYASWADYVTEDKMIGSAKKVREFIARITEVSAKRAQTDNALFLARKRKDEPKAAFVDQSESLYYEGLVKREKFAFDPQEVRQYFEFTQTRDGLLQITSKLFGIEYRRVPADEAGAWHPDVDVYDVIRDGEKLGRIFLDLHPRPGKYKHAAQMVVLNGVTGKQLPEGALVCNFPDPKAGLALMEHTDVVTMFHEFGHLMHHVLGGQQRWAYFSGVATEWDFVEAPSQLLEEWAWDVKTLQLFALHHETKQPIPEDLVKRMRAASELGKGTFVRHQMFYASVSLDFHSQSDPKALNATQRLAELQAQYSLFPYIDDTYQHASFGHLNGYSAIYYTYMWSLVIAKDLFSRFEKSGLLDERTAHAYRDAVLAPGGTKDAAVLVKNFLGRDYGFDAFRSWLERN